MDAHTGERQHFNTSDTFTTNPTFKMNGEPPAALTQNGGEDVAIQSLTKTLNKYMRRKRNKWTLIITFISLILIVIFITIAYLIAKDLNKNNAASSSSNSKCDADIPCTMQIVETCPSVLKYPKGSPKHDEISKHWKMLIDQAKSKIDILSFYWTMNGSDIKGGPYDQAKVGEEILTGLADAAQKGIKIRIVQTMPSKHFPQTDTARLSKLSNVEVRSLDMVRLVKAGIIHTKVWLVDDKHVYVGSANLDWRALTEVKELGTVLYNCSCAGQDLSKIFDTNWMLAVNGSKIPSRWPKRYQTNANIDTPMILKVTSGVPAKTYFSTSPPEFCAPKRTKDIDAILDLITKAKKFVYIAVMDYYAAIIYTYPKKYWDVIDAALREAVFNRGIKVMMLTSYWNHTNAQQFAFLQSLKTFGMMPGIKGSLQVKRFTMPWTSIPFSRVNHNKYMVTDNAAFVSTSNWSGDYFISTGGVSLVVNQTQDASKSKSIQDSTIQEQLRQVFLRDWNSQYAKELNETKISK